MEIAHKIRVDLMDYVSFMKLATSLMTTQDGVGIMRPEVIGVINDTVDFINYTSDDEIVLRGPFVLNNLEPIIKHCLKSIPIKKSLQEVGAAFRKLEREDKSIKSYGIPFGWLDKHIDTKFLIDYYTPYQTRIGIGYHVGKFAIEEAALLSDGFYFLMSSKKMWLYLAGLESEALKDMVDGYSSKEFYRKSLKINMNTCASSRNSIVNLYSFVECFVNSVGYDFLLRNENSLPANEQHVLKGHSKNGGFLSLEYKLEKIPQIINKKSKQTIFTLDIAQRKKPFLEFLDEGKEIRDASMHYSPLKHDIWRKPQDWLSKAQTYSALTLEVAKSFWLACYPKQEIPHYLFELDYQRCCEEGQARCDSVIALN